MLEMTIINVIFLTNVEKCFRVLITSLLALNKAPQPSAEQIRLERATELSEEKSGCRSSAGRLFHSRCLAAAKARSPGHSRTF